MLNRSSVEQGLSLALALCDAGQDKSRAIVPVAGSPLDTLCRVTLDFSQQQDYATYLNQSNQLAQTDSDKAYSDTLVVDAILYQTNSADPVTNESPHDLIIDELQSKIGPSILHHINHARNVVRPKIEHLVELVNGELDRRVQNVLLQAEVIEVQAPVFFRVPALVSSIEKYEGMTYNPELANTFALPVLGEVELRELIKTGNEAVDMEITAWLATEEDGWLEKLYTDFFTAATSVREVGNLHSFLRQISPVFGRMTASLDICKITGLYLLAESLYDNPTGKVEVPLAQYNRFMADLRDNLGALLVVERNEYYRAVNESQELVIFIEGNKVYVRSELYAPWIATGGDVDILYGNTLRQTPLLSIPDIAAQADTMREAWARHVALVTMTEQRNFETSTRNLLKRAIIDLIRDLDENERRHADQIAKIWNNELDQIYDREFSDIWAVVTRLVCRALYAHTDAEFYLKGINEICAANPGMKPRDAALIAAINYASLWLIKQMTVRS